MPMGKYPNFASCIKDQMKKGYNKKQASGICGLIEKRHKEKHELAQINNILSDFEEIENE